MNHYKSHLSSGCTCDHSSFLVVGLAATMLPKQVTQAEAKAAWANSHSLLSSLSLPAGEGFSVSSLLSPDTKAGSPGFSLSFLDSPSPLEWNVQWVELITGFKRSSVSATWRLEHFGNYTEYYLMIYFRKISMFPNINNFL